MNKILGSHDGLIDNKNNHKMWTQWKSILKVLQGENFQLNFFFQFISFSFQNYEILFN